MSNTEQNVGVIGLGIVGVRVAKCLREAGRRTYVWNRTPKAVPNALGSPADVARQAEVLQVFVRDGEALLDVIDNMLPALAGAHVVVNHATVSPEATAEAAARVAAAGAAFLDSPFTGSKDAAAAGKLNYYVGGDAAVLESVREVLEISSNSIIHVGDIGAATVLKIATNMITATTVAVMAEALAICESNGVDPAKMQDAMTVNACSLPARNPSMIPGPYGNST